MSFTQTDLSNLAQIVATHPTPEGVGSQNGMVKRGLLDKIALEMKAIQEKNTREPEVEGK